MFFDAVSTILYVFDHFEELGMVFDVLTRFLYVFDQLGCDIAAFSVFSHFCRFCTNLGAFWVGFDGFLLSFLEGFFLFKIWKTF